MALNFTSPFILSPPINSHHHKSIFLFLLRNNLEPSLSSSSSSSLNFWNSSAINVAVRASTSNTRNEVSDEEDGGGRDKVVLDDDAIIRASSMKDASEVLQMIVDYRSENGGIVSCEDCCRIINAAILCNNSDLALSIFNAMRCSAFDQVLKENSGIVVRWKWPRPDLNTCTTLVIGLAASLRVTDALKIVDEICRVGLSPGEEVPFGKIIKCPTCMVAVAVAQPQQGIQVVSCSKCRYQYELVSGDIVNIESEEIRISSCRTQHGCSSVEKMAGISSNYKANNSFCCPFYFDPNPIWKCSHA